MRKSDARLNIAKEQRNTKLLPMKPNSVGGPQMSAKFASSAAEERIEAHRIDESIGRS